jgi:hypothetical protein
MSRIYFPLQTSVELFGDRSTPEAITRVKQAAVLYDEVIIEGGLYTASISTAGSNGWWEPWSHVDPEKLATTRTPGKPGTEMAVGMQSQPGVGQPAEGPVHWFPQGELLIDYAAEFHTGIIDDLSEFEPDWLEVIAPGHVIGRYPEPVQEAIRAMNQRDFFDRELMRDRNSFERSWISKAFNQDAALASFFQATFNVTSLFAPMLERDELVPDRAGGFALELLVPNLGSLPWEGIIEFREHPGNDEARAQLRQFEETAAEAGPESIEEFKEHVQAEITKCFFQALDDLRPRSLVTAGKEGVKTLIGLVPFVGQVASGFATAGEIALAEGKYRNTWHAALLKLHEASAARG